MRYVLISPRIAIQKADFLGSGVPYWPIELATLASLLRRGGEEIEVIDLFGTAPAELEERQDHYLQGKSISSAFSQRARGTAPECYIVYALSYMSHNELLEICAWLRGVSPNSQIAVLENSQAVTAYSLAPLAADFFGAGANALICGESIHNWVDIKAFLERAGTVPPANVLAPGLIRPVKRVQIPRRTAYPPPAWDLFPVASYWALPYSHGPKTKRFLPILTSRGCPYPCDFCVVPETTDRRWHGNEPEEVVDEIINLRDRYNVHDFQIEDLNPTVNSKRFQRICELLIERQADIRFYIVSGTKAETVPIEQVPLLARAGCRYISISPESGSVKVMRVVGKPFDYDHGLKLVRACKKAGIRTQACFLVGHPAESEESIAESRRYLRRLVQAGLDEVAVFIVASFAGSRLYTSQRIAIADKKALPSFSPKGRADYPILVRRRRVLITEFFFRRLFRGVDLWLQGFRAIAGRPQTKMENLPWRALYLWWLILQTKAKARLAVNR
jgi:hypothetical protein